MNIVGEKITLRAIERGDSEIMYKWSNDPGITKMLGGWHFS